MGVRRAGSPAWGLTDLLLQIIDDKGNILPPNTEGNLGIRMKPTKPIGLFMFYEVRAPCLLLPGPSTPAAIGEGTQLCILRLLPSPVMCSSSVKPGLVHTKLTAFLLLTLVALMWWRSLASESLDLGADY